jgi:hypothetical protein
MVVADSIVSNATAAAAKVQQLRTFIALGRLAVARLDNAL